MASLHAVTCVGHDFDIRTLVCRNCHRTIERVEVEDNPRMPRDRSTREMAQELIGQLRSEGYGDHQILGAVNVLGMNR